MKKLSQAVLAGLLLATSSWAQDIPPDAKLPVESKYQNAPGVVQFPQASALYLSDDVNFRVLPDGSTEYEEHDVIKVLNDEGVAEHRELTRIYRGDLEETEVLLARTILPDGRVLEIPKEAILTIPAFEADATKVNAPMKRLTVRYPGVVPNSLIEFHLRTKRKPYPGKKWWTVSYVQNTDPMLESRFTVEVPRGEFWRYATPGLGSLAPTLSEADGVQRATWVVRNSSAVDVEAASPTLIHQLNRLEISNFRDWNDLRSWFDQNFEARVQTDSSVAQHVQTLIKPEESSESRLRTLGEWASKKRFMSGGLDDFLPATTSELIAEDIMGGLDAAVLMTGVYRAAGFKVQPVLAFEAPPEVLTAELPRFNRANHVLLRVSQADAPARSWWVDPRHPSEFSAEPPAGFQGGSMLAGTDKDKPLVSLESGSPDQNRVFTDSEARLDERGRLEVRFNTTGYGAAGTLYRELSRELNNAARDTRDEATQRLFDAIARGYGSKARVIENYFELNPRQGQPVDFAATVSVPDYAVPLEGKLAMVMPVRINDQLVNLALAEKPRALPVHLDHPVREENRLRLQLPPQSSVAELPATVNIQSPFGSYFATARQQGNEIFYYSRLEMNETWVPQAQTAELSQFARDVLKARGRLLVTPAAKSATES